MGTTNIALERVQALLKVDAGDGSLYEHLVRVVRKLAEDRPNDALNQLETLSMHLKSSALRPPASDYESRPLVPDKEAVRLREAWCASLLQMMRQPISPLPACKVHVQNFAEDVQMFAWAGVGFGKQEAHTITISLRQLAEATPGLTELRLWGKIMGTESDYIIAEGTLEPKGVEPPPQALPDSPEYDVEPKGTGPNMHLYWVTSGGSAPWVALPSARASHIVAARNIKKLMTGNLDAPVNSAPWFPGRECDLLRAQIARITASTKLAPSGLFEPVAESEAWAINMVEDSVYTTFPSTEPVSWVHAAPCLLKTGRTTWPNLELDELNEKSEEKDFGAKLKEWKDALELEKNNEGEDDHAPLEGIEKDLAEHAPEDAAEQSPAWALKNVYLFGGEPRHYRVSFAKSRIWPGATSVAQYPKFANLYVGYGMKSADLVPLNNITKAPLRNTSPFSPLKPADIAEEPQDEPEIEEPRPELPEEGSEGRSDAEDEEEG